MTAHKFDFLVVGSGAAGLLAAYKLADAGSVAVLSKREPEASNTCMAQGGIAALVFADHTYKVAACALGPVPGRCSRTEAVLNGNKLGEKLLEKAGEALLGEISPICDIRSSKEYRLHMARIMLARALGHASGRLLGKGPAYGSDNIC